MKRFRIVMHREGVEWCDTVLKLDEDEMDALFRLIPNRHDLKEQETIRFEFNADDNLAIYREDDK